jgi:hypothetical protein
MSFTKDSSGILAVMPYVATVELWFNSGFSFISLTEVLISFTIFYQSAAIASVIEQ